MGLQENLISVVETILCAETLEEALVTYTANITLLKDCKFFLFEGKSFPVPPVVNAEYANGMGCGYGIYALSHTDELLVLDKKRVMEMYDCMLLKCASISLKNELSDVGKKFSLLLDFVNYQLGYYLERELILCYLHFKRNTSVSRFFKRIQYSRNKATCFSHLFHVIFLPLSLRR